MKKTLKRNPATKKPELKREPFRILDAHELTRVAGAGWDQVQNLNGGPLHGF